MDRSYWINQLVGLLIRTLLLILFLNTLRGLLRQVSDKNRALRPDLVWLNLIPYFDYAWILITLLKVRASLRAELTARGRSTAQADSAFTVGLVSWILYVVTFALIWLLLLAPDLLIPVVGITSLVMIAFWIAYWSKIASLKNQLVSFDVVGAPVALPPGSAYQPGAAMPAQVAGSGAPVQAAEGATCPFCGGVCRPNAQFCSVCGRPVA